MSRLPIRLRLTLVFAMAMAAVIGGGGYLLYRSFAASLDRTLNQSLRTRAADAATLVQQVHGADGQQPERGGGLAEPPPISVSGDGFAQALDARGRVFDETRGLGRRPLLDRGQFARARRGPLLLPRVRRLGVDVRLLAIPVSAQDTRLVVVVGVPLRSRDSTLNDLRSELLLGGPLALLLASLVGYVVAAAALRPVERMRARAESISEQELTERLPVPRARDELARLGQTLNAMLARIEQGVARERRFVADASHELRSPLALLRAEVELALEAPRSGEELRDALRSVGKEADRLSQLAEGLLLLARLDEGRLELRPERIAVRELLSDVAARFSRRAEEAGRLIEVTAPDLIAGGDRLRLEQALGNLVENALRHGAGTIGLVARRLDDGIELHVTDEGSGFPAAFRSRAFERFSRADEARGSGGAGLGLAIAKAIVEAHEGSIVIASGPRGGADVRIWLPGSATTAAAPESARRHAPAPG